MPQAVELDPADTSRLDQTAELAFADRVDLERQAERTGLEERPTDRQLPRR
jgi:hypothetical protein